MIEGVREQVLSWDMIDEETWESGIRDLYRTAGPGGGVLLYVFQSNGGKDGMMVFQPSHGHGLMQLVGMYTFR